ELFVVSFGVGTKFRREAASNDGSALRDLHAEVLARRGLQRFLHQEVLRSLRGEACELLEAGAPRLRAEVSLHFYSSSVPCGNASWKRWAKGGTCEAYDEGIWPRQRHPRIHLHARSEGQAAFLVKGESVDAPVSVPPGCALFNPETEESQGPLCCSDKLAQWAALGVLGRHLSAAFEAPLRFSSCTIGRKFSWPHAARALCCRLQDFEAPGYGLQHLDLLGCSVKLDDGIYEDGAGADFSEQRCLVWVRGDKAAELLDGQTGLLEARGDGETAASVSTRRLAELAQSWRPLVDAEAAARQQAYCEAKRLLRVYVEERCSVRGNKPRTG
ncbi:unnamed protein product, partial [Effrenium voratum]